MSTSGKSSFKKLFQRSSSSPSTPSPPPPPPQPPQETFPPAFFCPITGHLMADPVIMPTGETFDQISINACRELNFTPPELSSRSIDFSSPFIPNLALKKAIRDWCDSAGRERPGPCSLQRAKGLVERAMRLGNQEPLPSSADRSDAADVFLKEILTKLKETPIPLKAFLTRQGSGNQESSSAAASAESSEPRITASTADDPPPSSSSSRTRSDKNLEKKILRKLKMSQISKNESGLANLIQLTKESPEHYRGFLCTPRIVAVLIPMLQSSNASISVSAMEAIYTFSLSPSNRIKIVQCGAVPHLVDVLTRGGIIEARAKAAGAIYNLAINEECRMAIGASGVMSVLVNRFFDPSNNVACREEAGLALCYLVLCSGNQTRFANCWAAIPLLLAATNYDESESGEEEEDVPTELRKCAVVLLHHLVGTHKGREPLMEIGIVSAMLRMVRKGEGIEVYCLAVLYNIFLHDSRGFRRLAIEARAEEVFAEMKEAWGEDGRELAGRMLEIVRGD